MPGGFRRKTTWNLQGSGVANHAELTNMYAEAHKGGQSRINWISIET